MLLGDTTVTTVNNNLNTTVTTVGDKYKTTEALFIDLNDLVNQQFKAWYCKMFFKLGRDEVMKRASLARSDARVDKKRYFSYLLKNYR